MRRNTNNCEPVRGPGRTVPIISVLGEVPTMDNTRIPAAAPSSKRAPFVAGLLAITLSLPALAGASGPDKDGEARGEVARAAFTTAVRAREPVDDVLVLEDDIDRIYFFTELRGLTGQRVTHQWEHDGQIVAEIPFNVRGPRWRVYSSKRLTPDMAGRWTVVVVDESGWPLYADILEYRPDGKLPAPVQAEAGTEPPAAAAN